MKFCATCGMPLEDESFIGLHQGNDVFCSYCIDENKKIKPCNIIFEGGVQYFMNERKFTRPYAEKVVRKNMTMLPHWKDDISSCLNGDMLSDEEFHRLFCE